jgi:3-oxoacyl-[acyl-carrier protein] reductase
MSSVSAMSGTRDASTTADMSGAELDRVVLITGAGSGIGAALARRIAAPRR